jgi:hypothetical protein
MHFNEFKTIHAVFCCTKFGSVSLMTKYYVLLIFVLFQGWEGFGLFPTDRVRDQRAGHLFFFVSVCMFLLPAFWWRYMNDQA